MRTTPFFLWANTPTAQARPAALTSPIYFLPMLYDALGAELPPYYALLRDLQEQIPAMEQGIYLDDAGRPVEESDLSPAAKAVLRDYRLVQYDLSVGQPLQPGRAVLPRVGLLSCGPVAAPAPAPPPDGHPRGPRRARPPGRW